MSLLLDKVTCKKAMEIILPAIKHTMDSGIAKRHDLHIVIADPTFTSNNLGGTSIRIYSWFDLWSARGGILYEHSLGDKDR